MATVSTSSTPPSSHVVARGVEPLRAGQGTSFVWRKLHSLLGIIPIGAFLLEHLISNFEALGGPVRYGEQVYFLNHLPLVRVLEWVFIFLPILYHGIYGLYIWLRGKANVVYYPWSGNWMYLAQRYTGVIAFIYIGYHVATQRFMGVSLPEHPGAAFYKVQHELANPWILAAYVIAMIAVCWHFAYGVWLFAAKWGITPGVKSRRRFAYVCAVGGILLCAMGLASIWAFTGPKYANAPKDVPVSYYQGSGVRAQGSGAKAEAQNLGSETDVPLVTPAPQAADASSFNNAGAES